MYSPTMFSIYKFITKATLDELSIGKVLKVDIQRWGTQLSFLSLTCKENTNTLFNPKSPCLKEFITLLPVFLTGMTVMWLDWKVLLSNHNHTTSLILLVSTPILRQFQNTTLSKIFINSRVNRLYLSVTTENKTKTTSIFQKILSVASAEVNRKL